MKREIKFRCWDTVLERMYPIAFPTWNGSIETRDGDYTHPTFFLSQNGPEEQGILLEYTGLKDKNGKEIYEFMELNNKWEVDWISGKYILRDIATGDIIDLDYENKYEITREYTKV